MSQLIMQEKISKQCKMPPLVSKWQVNRFLRKQQKKRGKTINGYYLLPMEHPLSAQPVMYKLLKGIISTKVLKRKARHLSSAFLKHLLPSISIKINDFYLKLKLLLLYSMASFASQTKERREKKCDTCPQEYFLDAFFFFSMIKSIWHVQGIGAKKKKI